LGMSAWGTSAWAKGGWGKLALSPLMEGWASDLLTGRAGVVVELLEMR
jgi:hypothetical protein